MITRLSMVKNLKFGPTSLSWLKSLKTGNLYRSQVHSGKISKFRPKIWTRLKFWKLASFIAPGGWKWSKLWILAKSLNMAQNCENSNFTDPRYRVVKTKNFDQSFKTRLNILTLV